MDGTGTTTNQDSTSAQGQTSGGAGQGTSAGTPRTYTEDEVNKKVSDALSAYGREKLTPLQTQIDTLTRQIEETGLDPNAPDYQDKKTKLDLKRERQALINERDALKAERDALLPFKEKEEQREREKGARGQIGKLIDKVDGVTLDEVMQITGGDIERAKVYIKKHGTPKDQGSDTNTVIPDSGVTSGGGTSLGSMAPKNRVEARRKLMESKK